MSQRKIKPICLCPERVGVSCPLQFFILKEATEVEDLTLKEKLGVNEVRVSGYLHFLSGESIKENRCGRYFQCSLRRDFIDINGEPRHDYLLMRTYDPQIEETLCSLEDGAPIYVEGEARSSLGSGKMYILIKSVTPLS